METIEVKIIKPMNVKQIQKFEDLTIENIARGTLDYTLADSRFPRRTGNLERSSMAQAVRKEADFVYCLDNPVGAEYAEYVWELPQETHWTNPNTYSKWFVAVFKEKNGLITKQAVDNSLRSVE